MKKSLYRKLLRMARDGDPEAIEAIAEVAEALLEPDTPDVNVTVVNTEPAAPPVVPVAEPAAPAQAVVPVAAAPAQAVVPASPVTPDPAAVISTPEGNEVVVDGDTLTEILYRLDRLIDLLSPANPPLAVNTPAPADCGTPAESKDDQLEEEIAEAVEEALEAVTVYEKAPKDVPADPAEALSALVEETLEPTPEALASILSSVLEPDEEEEIHSISEDVLRSALKAIRPRLRKMSPSMGLQVAKDLAGRINPMHKGRPELYNHMAISDQMVTDASAADLGRRIMASRNPNYKA